MRVQYKLHDGDWETFMVNHPNRSKMRPFAVGDRIEIPVHYDLWMRGARFGTVVSFHQGKPGQSAYIKVRMDHPQVKKLLKLWRLDWDYAKPI